MEVVMTLQEKRKVPRASFSITILDDEDYRLLMSERHGAEGFGVFVAVCLVGRQRLLDQKARRVDGTDSLRLENTVAHVLDMARVSRKQFDRLLDSLASVADASGSQPWIYIDDSGHVVIRSFFKFNADSNHGGPRPGAGRPISGNQDEIKSDSRRNQDASSPATRIPSVSVSMSVSDSVSMPPTPTGGARAVVTTVDPESLAVCQWANDLVTGWGPLAEGACKTYPPAWVREACSIAREAKASRWKFVDAILGRFKAQGGPDSARAPTMPRNTIAEKLGGGTLAERKARTKKIFEDLDRRNGVA
jgi:hypothetical protein